MLKSIKIEDFVNGEWVNDSNGLLDSVDSSGLWKLKLGDDCILESIEKLNSIEGRDIVDSIEGEDWVIVDNVEWVCVSDGEIWNIEVERKMLNIEVVEDVEMNEDNGGWIVVKVNENEVEEFVYFGFDFGESLCSCLIVEKDSNDEWIEKYSKEGDYRSSNIEDVFSEDICEKLFNMDFE